MALTQDVFDLSFYYINILSLFQSIWPLQYCDFEYLNLNINSVIDETPLQPQVLLSVLYL